MENSQVDARTRTDGRFADKVVVVTGAAQGIGAGVARGAAAEGAAVVLADRAELVIETSRATRCSRPSGAAEPSCRT